MERVNIQAERNNILQVGILDENGNDSGEYFEFDVEDIELPLRLNRSSAMHHNNCKKLKATLLIIDKKKDFTKKGQILSNNEKEKLKAFNQFYADEEKALDLFLGEGTTKKYLKVCKRNPYYSMYEDINEKLEPILPKLKCNIDNLTDKIKNKYKTVESDVITSD